MLRRKWQVTQQKMPQKKRYRIWMLERKRLPSINLGEKKPSYGLCNHYITKMHIFMCFYLNKDTQWIINQTEILYSLHASFNAKQCHIRYSITVENVKFCCTETFQPVMTFKYLTMPLISNNFTKTFNGTQILNISQS